MTAATGTDAAATAAEAGVLLDVAAAVGRIPKGAAVRVDVGDAPGAVALVRRWCERTANTFLGVREGAVEVHRGRLADPIDDLAPERRPGHRLWIYTNFDCNLACDYCCAASSPRAPRMALGTGTIDRLVREAAAWGVAELFLTGGEPFLLADLGAIAAGAAALLPTTILTNGMLLRGARLAVLDSLPRENLALQISLDSAAPELHDRHRGAGSHARVLSGIDTAQRLGFRVRIAATLATADDAEEARLGALCDELGVRASDRVFRRIAQEGNATGGIALTRSSLVPEICVTAAGVVWHPVAPLDPSMRVTSHPFPLAAAIDAVRDEFRAHRRRATALASTFPCA